MVDEKVLIDQVNSFMYDMEGLPFYNSSTEMKKMIPKFIDELKSISITNTLTKFLVEFFYQNFKYYEDIYEICCEICNETF